jgi:hypothetical protein
MSRALRATRTLLAALALSATLGFGVSSALALPPDALVGPPVCPRTAVGKCTSLTQCQGTCASLGLDPAQARCDASGGVGCCYCPLVL